jgi:D-alanyl-D-alanine carboxypeptidase
MRLKTLVVPLALCGAVLEMAACGDSGGGGDAGTDGGTDTDTDADGGTDGGEDRSPECLEQDEKVQAAVDEWHVTPNTVVAVRNEQCGVSVYANGDPADATTDSLFLLASVTKTFVAAAVMSLVEEGSLQLDDQIGTWFPDLDPIYEPVTVRMLLNHTSGIYNYTDDLWTSPDLDRVWTQEELVDIGFSHAPYCEPGAEFNYSNTNYILLGLILEQIEGKPVSQILRERAIAPANLEHTFFTPEEEVVGDMATPFNFNGTEIGQLYDMSILWTAGGMVSVAADTANWMWELYGARSVIQSGSVDQMLGDPVVTWQFPLETTASYGLGTCIDTLADTNCGVGVGHNGRWQWSSTDAFYFEDCDVSIAVMQNALLDPPELGVELVLTKVLGALYP